MASRSKTRRVKLMEFSGTIALKKLNEIIGEVGGITFQYTDGQRKTQTLTIKEFVAQAAELVKAESAEIADLVKDGASAASELAERSKRVQIYVYKPDGSLYSRIPLLTAAGGVAIGFAFGAIAATLLITLSSIGIAALAGYKIVLYEIAPK